MKYYFAKCQSHVVGKNLKLGCWFKYLASGISICLNIQSFWCPDRSSSLHIMNPKSRQQPLTLLLLKPCFKGMTWIFPSPVIGLYVTLPKYWYYEERTGDSGYFHLLFIPSPTTKLLWLWGRRSRCLPSVALLHGCFTPSCRITSQVDDVRRFCTAECINCKCWNTCLYAKMGRNQNSKSNTGFTPISLACTSSGSTRFHSPE